MQAILSKGIWNPDKNIWILIYDVSGNQMPTEHILVAA